MTTKNSLLFLHKTINIVEPSNRILKEEFYSLCNSDNNLRPINKKLIKWLVFVIRIVPVAVYGDSSLCHTINNGGQKCTF